MTPLTRQHAAEQQHLHTTVRQINSTDEQRNKHAQMVNNKIYVHIYTQRYWQKRLVKK
jgi:hypothetical protein